MRDVASRFAKAAQDARVARPAGRAVARLGALGALVAIFIAVPTSPAWGAYAHTNVTGEYGKEGPKASGIGSGCRLGYQSANHHLYLFADQKIYGLDRTAPGSVTPLAGFPINGTPNGSCGDPDFEVDNSSGASKNNLYALDYGSGIFGWSSGGAPLVGWGPVGGSTQSCGVAVDNEGDVWNGSYSTESAKEYSPAGALKTTVVLGFRPCKLAIDRTNNDLFVQEYGGFNKTWKYTSASGYNTNTKTEISNFGGNNPGLAVNGAQHRIYIANGSPEVRAYSTTSGSLLEKVSVSPLAQDVVVDEPTDTLFVTAGGGDSGVIKEIAGVVVPDVTTGEPEGNSKVNGVVELGGGGEVIECYFEFGLSKNPYSSKESCSPGTPYVGTQNVTANLPGLTGEQTYHYRLVAHNANGENVGEDKTITPHYVVGITTDEAEDVTRRTAKLKAHFTGNGEETKYYFEWGTSPLPYEHQSATPPGTSIGSPVGPANLSFEATGLQPQILYHYRVVASNPTGISPGADRTFETPPAVGGLSTGPPTNVTPEAADLTGSFVGDGNDTQYYFQWGSSTAYGHATTPVNAGQVVGPISVTATITELVALHPYHYRIVATNSFGTTFGADESFETVSAPTIVGLSSSGVLADSADLHAVINPQGKETTYHFEYGATSYYGSSTAAAVIPASNTDQSVSVHISGLKGIVYHFRVVASSASGVTTSVDQTFSFYPEPCPNETLRQQTGSSRLPDCRAYELVSPEDAGSPILFPASMPFSPTATNPSRLAFGGVFGLIEGVGKPANDAGDLYVATRGPTGWKTKYIGLPADEAAVDGGPPWLFDSVQGSTGTYDYFRVDNIHMNVLNDPSMSRIVSWNDGYYPCAPLPGPCPGDGNGRGLRSSNAPYVWESTSGALQDRWPTNLASVEGGEEFTGKTAASADLSHFVFSSANQIFAAGGIPGDLYDNDTVHRTVSIVSRDEADNPIQVAPVELSSDGSHILMISAAAGRCPGTQALTCHPGRLYMRVNDEKTHEKTYDIAANQSVDYVDMTPDGSKVYFTSENQLSAEDGDHATDLYMWSETSEETDKLTVVSRGDDPIAGNTESGVRTISFTNVATGGYTGALGGAGGNAFSESSIASSNGDIYFFSGESLSGSNAVPGKENLFVYRNGKVKFVTTLDGSVSCVENQPEFCSDTGVARMNISPDGSHMAFLTDSRVTAYDNQGNSEIYLYTPSTGDLACASCRPNGEPPTLGVRASHNGLFMANDGRVFFSTKDPLVPQDTNRAEDVYEFIGGRPQLISSGTARPNETEGVANNVSFAGLVGVSADGSDVYFSTFDVLVGQDRNGENLKIYDARTGGGFPFVPPSPGCAAADECHGPGSSALPSPTNGTGAYLGASGNLKARHKKAGHKRNGKKKKPNRKKREKKNHHRRGR